MHAHACRREIALNGWTLVLCERGAAPATDAPPSGSGTGAGSGSAAAPAPAPAPAPLEPSIIAFDGPARNAPPPSPPTASGGGGATQPTVPKATGRWAGLFQNRSKRCPACMRLACMRQCIARAPQTAHAPLAPPRRSSIFGWQVVNTGSQAQAGGTATDSTTTTAGPATGAGAGGALGLGGLLGQAGGGSVLGQLGGGSLLGQAGGALAQPWQQLLAQRPVLTAMEQQLTAIASGIGEPGRRGCGGKGGGGCSTLGLLKSRGGAERRLRLRLPLQAGSATPPARRPSRSCGAQVSRALPDCTAALHSSKRSLASCPYTPRLAPLTLLPRPAHPIF